MNLIIIGFIIALIVLSMFWAFNTVRRIEIQKNFCAGSLISIAKLWRRAKFVPEDAKERESLYLYRDFLRKFDESECKYPIMVKNGGVRAMTRKEFDEVTEQKPQPRYSILVIVASVLVAIISLVVNIAVTKTVWVGIGLALIMPVVQVILFLFLSRFEKEKNIYRDGIFLALKENSINFLSITKPFIIVDAYPEVFGKKTKPLYSARGELNETQIADTREFIIKQKSAESEVVLRNVDNTQEIEQLNNPQPSEEATPVLEDATPATPNDETTVKVDTEENAVENVGEQSTDNETQTTTEEATLTDEEIDAVFDTIMDNIMEADVERAINEAEQAKVAQQVAEQQAEQVVEVETTPKEKINTEVVEPAEDDFSLDAIGQALDAEIAKRNKKRR
ncbi:MAG: hypothetical protein J6B20_02900 [Clostridia bacterium]|nr:hypothetical protein [Clostridia bacterium]